MTTDEKIWRRLAISWGVTPILAEEYPNMDVMMYYAAKFAKETFQLEKGDNIVITGGPVGVSGRTNTIKVETV